MTDAQSTFAGRAAELRLAFDRSFALPPRPDNTPTEDFLAIGVSGQAVALRLSDVAGLFADRKVTRIPGRAAALLGIAGFRGTILPVYDLGLLLGRPAVEARRWLVIVSEAPVALAFGSYHGHLRISKEAVLSHENSGPAGLARDYLRVDGIVRSVVHLPSVIDVIKAQARATAPREEHRA
jgi:purine-binding chemotaxis protein CheW